jgi:hypothetical protein
MSDCDRAYIYALCDPRNDEIRYVGLTIEPKHRYRVHCRATDDGPRGEWISELSKEGLRPRLVVLETTTRAECANAEKWWINLLANQGHSLTNKNRGGSGMLFWTEEQRKRMSQSRLGMKRGKRMSPVTQAERDRVREQFEKLSKDDVCEIRKLLACNILISSAEIGERFGVCIGTIESIGRGRAYSRYTQNDGWQEKIKRAQYYRGSINSAGFPGIDVIIRAFEMMDRGVPIKQVESETGISWANLRSMKYRDNFRWLVAEKHLVLSE